MIERPITHTSPRATVVIPTIPENSHDVVVEHLQKQSIQDFEVIVVNDESLDICEARNRGLDESSSDVVLFTDDNTHPPKYWVEEALRTFENTPAAIVEGPVEGGMKNNKRGMYVGCNIAVEREVALEVGGFDSAFEGWRDDTDFGWRVEKKYKGEWNPKMVMYHPEIPNSSFNSSKEFVFRNRHPRLYENRVRPDTFTGQVNHWLWKKGFWDVVDKVRT